MILKVVNHILVMMTGKNLATFAVSNEELLQPGKQDLSTASIKPVEELLITANSKQSFLSHGAQ